MLNNTNEGFKTGCLLALKLIVIYGMTGSGCSTPSLYEQSRHVLLPAPAIKSDTKAIFVVAGGRAHNKYKNLSWISDLPKNKMHLSPVGDYYSLDLFDHVINNYPNNSPVIHLGNGIEIGCKKEFERFIKIISNSSMWVMTPGTHEGFYLGGKKVSDKNWTNACGRQQRLTKDFFIEEYLKQLVKQGARKPNEFGDFKDNPDLRDLVPNGKWEATINSNSFIQKLNWRIDRKAPWKSFIVQEILLPSLDSEKKIHAILLDTFQPISSQVPKTSRVASDLIERTKSLVGDNKTSPTIINKWLRDGALKGTLIVLMGNSPIKGFFENKETKRLLMSDQAILYVSNVKGQSGYKFHGKGVKAEAQLGSIGVWPHPFWFFGIGVDESSSAVLLRSRKSTLVDSFENFSIPYCQTDWKAKGGESYPSYQDLKDKEGSWQLNVQREQLRMLQRLFEHTPSQSTGTYSTNPSIKDEDIVARIKKFLNEPEWTLDDGQREIEQLQRIELNRTKRDSLEHADYRLCQALWATKAEYNRIRPISLDDPYIYLKLPR